MTKIVGGPALEPRKLYCLACGHLFFSGSLHCPSCLEYGTLVEPDESMLKDIKILEGIVEGRKKHGKEEEG
jgi:hypothetical protein